MQRSTKPTYRIVETWDGCFQAQQRVPVFFGLLDVWCDVGCLYSTLSSARWGLQRFIRDASIPREFDEHGNPINTQDGAA